MMNTQIIKKSMLALLTVLLLSGLTASDTLAQRGAGKGKAKGWNKQDRGICMQMPDLSEEQMDKISGLRTSFMKETLEVRNEIAVKKAELKALSAGDDVDLKKVNSKIDEIAELRADMMKKHAAHRQDIRALLNEEQQVLFDQHGPGFGRGMDKGRMHRSGRGFGPGTEKGYGPFCPWRDAEED